jgi:hypothetical protein
MNLEPSQLRLAKSESVGTLNYGWALGKIPEPSQQTLQFHLTPAWLPSSDTQGPHAHWNESFVSEDSATTPLDMSQ